MTTPRRWYFLENGKQSSPVLHEDILDRVRRGALSADDLVWAEGMADWVPLRTAMPEAFQGIPVPPAPPASLPQAQGKSRTRVTAGVIFEIFLAAFGVLMLAGVIVEIVWGLRVHDFSNKPYIRWILITAAAFAAAYYRRERRLSKEMPTTTGFVERHGTWLKNVAASVIAAGILFTATCWSTINEDIFLRSQGYGPSPRSARAAAVKADLRNLATAEELFFADSTTYTSRLDLLQFTPSSGVTVRITSADSAAWAAVATEGSDASKGCAIWSGSGNAPAISTPAGLHPSKSLEPLCDVGM